MNLENSIKDCISKKLEDGTIEHLVEEQLQKGIQNALNSLFSSYGDVTKVIEREIKSVMLPHLERFNYSKYIMKLDTVLTEILESTTSEHTMLLENFKGLMTDRGEKSVTVEGLFEKYKEYVADNVETKDLDVIYEDGERYEPVNVSYDLEVEDSQAWSCMEYATLTFLCEEDEDMNFGVRLNRYKQDESEAWNIRYDVNPVIRSIRFLKSFEIELINLTQCGCTLSILQECDSDEVTPDKEPE